MAIIKNYGLRWARDKVQWGSAGKSGTLQGKLVGSKRSKSINFREQIGLYVLYETGFVPVYIGQAGIGNARLYSRLKHHRDDHLRDRWTHFSWFGFRDIGANGELYNRQRPGARVSVTYTAALDEVEGILIQVLEPRLNRQGAKWKNTAEEYVQDGPAEESYRMQDIADRLDGIEEKLNDF